MTLADDLVEGVGPHPDREWRGSPLGLLACRVEEARHLAVTCPGHVMTLSGLADRRFRPAPPGSAWEHAAATRLPVMIKDLVGLEAHRILDHAAGGAVIVLSTRPRALVIK